MVGGKRRSGVRFDYRRGMTQLVEHLYELGHRRMAYIGYPLPLGPIDERRNAFLAATKEFKVKHFYLFVREHSDLAAGRDAVRELLSSDFAPTAILCVNDLVAIGVLRELRNRNISVPGEISVTGFDNIAFAEFSSPSITTINVPRERIASALFRNLVATDEQTAVERAVYTVDPELILRESTGPAPRKPKR
jgi:LacI family transcriptional regulator